MATPKKHFFNQFSMNGYTTVRSEAPQNAVLAASVRLGVRRFIIGNLNFSARLTKLVFQNIR